MTISSASPKVSIIIPIFNAADYLPQCLKSVLSQSYQNFEVICVDDGSTDRSLLIMEEFAKKDSRVRLFTQTNAGPGIARNTGLDQAKGDYVYCLDADDFLEHSMLARCIDVLDKTKADMALFAFRTFNEQVHRSFPASWGMRHVDVYPSYPAGVFNWTVAPDFFFETIQNIPWNKMISRRLIVENNIHFQDIHLTEDALYSLPAAVCAKKIVRISKPLMCHREFIGTSLMDTKDRYPLDFLIAFDAVRSWLKAKGEYEALKLSWQRWFLNAIYYNLPTYENVSAFNEAYDLLTKNELHYFDLSDVNMAAIEEEPYVRLYKALKTGSREAFLLACSNSGFEEAANERCSGQRKLLPENVAALGVYEKMRTAETPLKHALKGAQKIISR